MKQTNNLYVLPQHIPEISGAPISEEDLSVLVERVSAFFANQDNSPQDNFPQATFSQRINAHVGSSATYSQKSSVREGLQMIYEKFKANNTSDSERKIIALKLAERALACTPGFHDGVNAIVDGFYAAKDIGDLLYRVRQDMVARIASRLTDEVHTNNHIFTIAEQEGYGTHALNKDDTYVGNIPPETIRGHLRSAFEEQLNLFSVLQGLEEQLKGQLINFGYEGFKEDGYDAKDYNSISDCLKLLFSANPLIKSLTAAEYKLAEQLKANEVLREKTYIQIEKMISQQCDLKQNKTLKLKALLGEGGLPSIMLEKIKPWLDDTLKKLSKNDKVALELIKRASRHTSNRTKVMSQAVTKTIEVFNTHFFIHTNDAIQDVSWVNVRQLFWEEIKLKEYFEMTPVEVAQLDVLLDPKTPKDVRDKALDELLLSENKIEAVAQILAYYHVPVSILVLDHYFHAGADKRILFKILRDSLKHQEAAEALFGVPYLAQLVQSTQNFITLIKRLSPEQATHFLNAMKEQLPQIIKSVEDFNHVLDHFYVSPEQCIVICEGMKEQLPHIIKSVMDLESTQFNLDPEQRTVMFESMKEHLPQIIKSVEDFRKVQRFFSSSEQRTVVYENMKEHLPKIIKSALDFQWVRDDFSPEQCTAVCDSMKEYFPQIIKSVLDFQSALWRLSPEQSIAVCDSMKERLPGIIKSSKDLPTVVCHFCSKQRPAVYSSM